MTAKEIAENIRPYFKEREIMALFEVLGDIDDEEFRLKMIIAWLMTMVDEQLVSS